MSENNTIVIKLEGRIDTRSAEKFERELLKAAEDAKGASFILDASHLDFLSSAGLRALMKFRKAVGTPVQIQGVSDEIYSILDITGFTNFFDVRKR